MRSRTGIRIAALSVVAVLAIAIGWLSRAAPSTPHRCIFVTPLWPDGTVARDAIVRATESVPDRTTDPVPADLPRHAVVAARGDGSAPLPWFPESLGTVFVRAWTFEGKAVAHYGEATISAGAPENARFTVTMYPDRALRVRVVDSGRRPVAGVELHALAELRREDGTAAPAARCAVARTDEDGEATFFRAGAWLHRIVARESGKPFAVRIGSAPDVAIDLDAADLPDRRFTLQMPDTVANPSRLSTSGSAVAHDDAAIGELELVSGRIVAPRGVDDVTIAVVDGTRDTNVATRVDLKPDGSFVVRGRDPGASPLLVVRSPEYEPLAPLAMQRGETDRAVTLVPRPAVEVPFRVPSRELAVCLDYVLVRDADGSEVPAKRRVWSENGVMTCRFVTDGLGPHHVVVRPKARKDELVTAPVVITATDDSAPPLAVPTMRVLRVDVPAAIGEGTTDVQQLVAGVPLASLVPDGSTSWLVASDAPIDLRIRVPGHRELVASNVNADFAKMPEPK